MPAMADPVRLPEAALSETFLAATGPGGQNVNKVATAVQLRIDVAALGLPNSVRLRLKALAGRRWTQDDAILLIARSHRTQEANRADARARAVALIEEALVRPERRIATRPSKGAKERRLESKAVRSSVKRDRGRIILD